jgi:tetratricopeptide (TPR) repeat protein
VGTYRMIRMKAVLFLVLCLAGISLAAQTSSKNDEIKLDAEYYLMLKDYNKALDIYLKILRSEPENADIKHRIGICYLNSENKAKAIPYLEEAVQKVSAKYNPNSLKEENASFEAYFALGSAYRVNNELDKAIEAYSKFKEYLDRNDDYNIRVADQYIKSCNLAKEMQQHPVVLKTTNLGGVINNERSNFNAVLSGDGKTLFYTSPGRQGYEIFMSAYADSGWTAPKNMTSVLGTGKFMKTCDLSADGLTLLLALEDPENSDIYISHLSKGRWSKVAPLDKTVNTSKQETHASLSPDNSTLYFTSDRKGGEGDLDIYKSVINSKGEWGKAVNMGPGVNTFFNEETPFVSPDGQVLFFSSEGHEGMGGYDVYRYSLGSISAGAVNLGYPLNTTDNDLFYFPVGDGMSAYYAYAGPGSFGGKDIYAVTVSEAEKIPEVAEEVKIPEVAEDVKVPEVVEEVKVPEAIEEVKVAEVAEDTGVAKAEEPLAEAIATPVTFTASSSSSYSIQIMALRKPVDLSHFPGLTGITVVYRSDRWYRYTVGATTQEQEAVKTRDDMISKGYHDAFIRLKNLIPRYTIQVMAVPGPLRDLSAFSNLPEVSVTRAEDNFCRYTTGEFETSEEAAVMLEKIKMLGYSKAFIRKVD